MGILDAPARPQLKVGGRGASLGDSLTLGASAANTQGGAWPYYASILSNGDLRMILCDGFAGKRTDEVATHLSDVLAAGVSWCTVQCGTNDILQSIGVPTIIANLKSIYQQLAGAGILPVLCTLPPHDSDTTGNKNIGQVNAWILRYGAVMGYPVLNFYSLLVDPTTGNYSATYVNDGVHPNQAGYLAMGNLAWQVLAALVRVVPPVITRATPDGNNLLPNNLFLTDANADGIPDSWTRFGGGTGFVNTIDLTDGSIKGGWAVITNTAASATQTLEFNATTGFAVGDRLLLTGRVSVANTSGGGSVSVKVTMTGNGGIYYPVYQLSQTVAGVFYMEIVVPASTTAVLFDFIAAAGTVTAKLAQPTLYNLTAMHADPV